VKTARIYGELATYARAHGYGRVTDAAVHDWRKRGMLPSARSLGRRKRRPGRIPEPLRDRLLAICRYRYDRKVADLRIVTLLLWLDDGDIALDHIRAALPTIHGLAERLVALAGSGARRADPEDTDADVDATATAVASGPLASAFGGEAVGPEALHAALFDALRLALGRGDPDEVDDLAPLAMALGLGRAHTEAPHGSSPWLAGDPAAALADALGALFGSAATETIVGSSDDDLVYARETTRSLVKVVEAAGAIQVWFPRGAAGLGFLRATLARPEFPAVVLYVAILRPSVAAAFASQFTPEQLSEWTSASGIGIAWLKEHPELETEVEARGLLAVIQQWMAGQRDSSDGEPTG
jgi:hypothetical protein